MKYNKEDKMISKNKLVWLGIKCALPLATIIIGISKLSIIKNGKVTGMNEWNCPELYLPAIILLLLTNCVWVFTYNHIEKEKMCDEI